MQKIGLAGKPLAFTPHNKTTHVKVVDELRVGLALQAELPHGPLQPEPDVVDRPARRAARDLALVCARMPVRVGQLQGLAHALVRQWGEWWDL